MDNEEPQEPTRAEWKVKAQELVAKYLDRDDDKHYSAFIGDETPKNSAEELIEIVEALLRYRFDWGWKDRSCPIDFNIVNLETHEPLQFDPPLRCDKVPPKDRTKHVVSNAITLIGQLDRDLNRLRHRLWDEEAKMDKFLKRMTLKAVKKAGTYKPEIALCQIEEDLTTKEAEAVTKFLSWVYQEDRKFGPHTIDQVFKEFYKLEKEKRIQEIIKGKE